MNAERLLALYDRVADAPDAVSRLRRFVLDLAVRGKLVEQHPSDEPASELLAQIVADKKQREVSIRRRRTISTTPVHVDEMRFNLPASWVWTRFGDITISRDGERVPVSKTERQHRAKIYDYYGASGVIDKIDGYLFDKPLLLIGEDGANLINRSTPIAFIARGKYWVNNHAHVIDGLSEEYLRYVELFINATDLKPFVTGTAQPKMNQAKMNSIPVAVPPLAEQHRIVAKVDELMTLCDRLEEARITHEETRDRLTNSSYARLSATDTDDGAFRSNSRFAVDALPQLTARADQVKRLRQTILNLAVRGKLVEQDPADEPASELLKQIAAEKAKRGKAGLVRKQKPILPVEATPFAVPLTWGWAYLANIADFSAGRTPPRNDTSYWNNGDFAWVSIADMKDGETVQATKETVSEKARFNVFKSEPETPGTMIMSFKLTIGKIARLGIPAFHNEAIISIRPYLNELDEYLFKVLPDLARSGDTKGAIKGATLNRESLSKIMFPLPPLAEQHRIVAKVDELMTLCDRLETNLGAVDTGSHLLLVALLRDALENVGVHIG